MSFWLCFLHPSMTMTLNQCAMYYVGQPCWNRVQLCWRFGSLCQNWPRSNHRLDNLVSWIIQQWCQPPKESSVHCGRVLWWQICCSSCIISFQSYSTWNIEGYTWRYMFFPFWHHPRLITIHVHQYGEFCFLFLRSINYTCEILYV